MQLALIRNRSFCHSSVLFLAMSLTVGTAAEPNKPAAKLVELNVFPNQIVLSDSRRTQGLRVTGRFDDGSLRDLTSDCKFQSNAAAVADVSETGVVTPRKNGSATVDVVFGKHSSAAVFEIRKTEDVSYHFKNDVLPVIENLGCNQMGCHGSPKGKKRLHLSLFSADPHKDFLQITNPKSELLDLKAPERSWLLLKATCEEDHDGGDVTAEGDPAWNLLVDWIRNKAPEGNPDDAELERIEVFPAERTMIPGTTQHLLVEAYYSDGSMRDVTDLAAFKSSEEAIAAVDEAGRSEISGYGETVVMVTYGGRMATSRITSAQPVAVPFPDVPAYNRIDELVYNKLRSLNIIPSELCSDEEFQRRTYLDVVGVLPTVEQTRTFLADTNTDKRSRLIDSLLERPEYADFYALKWGDILQINRAEPARLQDKGMWAYYRWLWKSLDQNKPMDQFTREILTARGSAYESGPANFFRVGEGAQGMAEHASTAFLGVRLDCAHCHNHPFEQFTLVDNLGMAAFFSQVRTKRTLEQDEEVIYVADSGSVKNPDTKQNASPRYLGGDDVAAAEKSVVEKAAVAKSAADKRLAQETAAVKAATNTAKADKAAADKVVAAKTKIAQKAAARGQAAKTSAAEAMAEKAAAQKAMADAQTALADAAKAMNDAQAAVAQAANSSKDEEPSKEVKAAQQKAAQQVSAATAAMDDANADMATANGDMSRKTTAAQAAVELAKTTRAAADQATAERAVAAKLASRKAADHKVILTKVNATRTIAAKEAAQVKALHQTAIARLVAVETTGDLRSQLVDWMVAPENPYFARHMANRVWCWLMGRGIVHEPDDFRSTNPPSNPVLLDYLGEQFVESGFDMKAMFRLVLNSRTYQFSAQPNEWNKADRIHHSYYHLKRLSAEQLAQAISQVTGVAEKYPGLPLGTRATQLPDISMRSEFLDLFGRPKRATPVESERTCETHIGQSLQMISSDYMARKLRDNNGLAARLAASQKPVAEVVDELYLTTFSRLPTDTERNVILAEPIEDKRRREKFEDLLWVLMNTKEFLFNH